tara:strand:- start:758 stop:1438 length:681 start_codon:yes stop_codon:yes gene_type:complete
MSMIAKHEQAVGQLDAELEALQGRLAEAQNLSLQTKTPAAKIPSTRLALREEISIVQERRVQAEIKLCEAKEDAALQERMCVRDQICSLTDTLVAEVRKVEVTLKRGARHYRKVLELEAEIRRLSPDAEGWPSDFFGHSNHGLWSYSFLCSAVPKHYGLTGQHISGWPKQRDWDLNGTPERTYSGLVEQRDRWRHPEQFIEEKVESGWREATSEEIKDVHSSEFQS